jgi:hypothetical protein
LRGPKRLRKATSSTVAARPRRGLRRPATPSGLRMDVTLSFLAASEPSALAEQPYGTAYVFRQVGGRRPGHFSRDRAERLSRLVARLESECRPRSKAERIAPEAVLRRHAARRDHQLHGGAIQEETHPCGLGERYRQSRTRDPLSPKPAAPLHRNYTEALKGSRQQRPQLGGKNRNYRVLGPGGRKRNRTAVRGFAVLCIATLPSGRLVAAYRLAPRNWSRTPDGVWHIAHALVAGRRCAPYIG